MATQSVTDVVVVPQSKGTGLSSEDDVIDAAASALLSQCSGSEEVIGLEFTRDDAADQIDVGPGIAFVKDDSGSTASDRGSGGNPRVQSNSTSGYDIEVPENPVYLVIMPSTVSVAVTDNTNSDIWLDITDVTSNNSVEIRSSSGGGSTSAPTDTFVKIGTVNDSGTGDPVERTNDYPDKTFGNLTFDDLLKDASGNTVATNVVSSGNVTLSSSSATVDTGISESTTATFYVALGPDTDDAEIVASMQANSGGNYTLHLDEINTSVGNPTVRYDIVRVR